MSKVVKKASKVEVDVHEDRKTEQVKALLNGDYEMFDEELELEEEEDFEDILQHIEDESVETIEVEEFEVDDEVSILLGLRPTKSRPSKKIFGEEGVCTIVNSTQNGNKRIVLASKLLEKIGNPTEVEVGIMPNGIAIANSLPIETNVFPVRKQGAKKIIYAGPLVAEITKEFNLDYSNRTSITFNQVRYEQVEGNSVAIIKIA